MPNTPVLALPYPAATDPLANGAAAVQALATGVETALKIKAGKFTGTTDANGNVLIPHGLGVKPRAILLTLQLTAAVWIASTYDPNTTATNIAAVIRTPANVGVASTQVQVNWLAVG